MFQGTFEHSLDDKGRLAVPSALRRKLGDGDGSDPVLIVTISDQCLAAYPEAQWKEKLAMLAQHNQFKPEVMRFKRVFVGSAQECPVDKAGRILIPADLRKYAGIDKDCVIIGQLEKIEIWAEERWRKTFSELQDQVGSIYAQIADLGIDL